MTQILKNVRFMFFAVILGASCCGIANAQEVMVKDTVISSALFATFFADTKASDTVESSLVNKLSRRIYMVSEEGNFKNEFASLSEALDASRGNSYNQTLKKGNEIIVMNSRCGTSEFIAPVTFSIYQLDGAISDVKDLSPIVQYYLDNIKDKDQKTLNKMERELIDKVMETLSVSRFPQKNACDPVPVALSLTNFQTLRLEADDAQNPLIGAKFNNGTLYVAISGNEGFMASEDAKKRAFWDKYSYNSYSNVQDAAEISRAFPGTKAIIFNGSNFAFYRIETFKFPDNTDGTKNFDILKTTPMPKGWVIVMVVSGSKFIKIYDKNAK